MEGKENIPVSSVRNSIEILQKERSKVEWYLHELTEFRKSLEETINKVENEISKLNDEQSSIDESTTILKFKVERLEKEANQWEEKNKYLRGTIEDLQIKIDGYKEKRLQETDKFEKVAADLCDLFSSVSIIHNDDTIQTETNKLYGEIEQLRIEFEEKKLELDRSRNELDDIVLYQVPRNPKEAEIPLGQRKAVLKLFEDAHMKSKARIEHLNHVKSLKEEELGKLSLT
ncbi:uncharacterized protein TNIN_352151 [Trichonephila inaurata madagascariensis]|uniref:Uncharacterized protein n=1 Tax=Trichonephila inaurata madagascariensis TaxID=2747483 RepID=A0A8X6YGP4_9ARAC|nr:uncharacterized protein TNIN_352151 [Trichonephila inaurata madagascariensis]